MEPIIFANYMYSTSIPPILLGKSNMKKQKAKKTQHIKKEIEGFFINLASSERIGSQLFDNEVSIVPSLVSANVRVRTVERRS